MEASDGVEALGLVKSRRPEIDLLLTDVVMPHLSGRKLRKLLEDYHSGIRTLFISGYADKSSSEEVDCRLDVEYLQKPFTTNGLRLKIREVLDGR